MRGGSDTSGANNIGREELEPELDAVVVATRKMGLLTYKTIEFFRIFKIQGYGLETFLWYNNVNFLLIHQKKSSFPQSRWRLNNSN